MRSRRNRFLAVVLILWACTAYEATQLWPSHVGWASMLAVPFFALMIGWQFIYHSHPEAIEARWFRALAWVGSLMFGFWASFMLFSIPLDLIRLALTPFFRAENAALARWIPWGALVGSAGISALGLATALRGPRVKDVSIPIACLPKNLDGFMIAQISDLHVGPTIRKRYVESVVRRVNALAPDVIAITGDLADGEPQTLDRHLSPLAGLKAKSGIFYVTGNHEYYWGAEAWVEKARELGWTALLNQSRIVEREGGRILIAGITDVMAEQFVPAHRSELSRISEAIKSNPDCGARILLAHRPEGCVEAESMGFELQLSGHTHAGQFFPFSVLVSFAHKYYRGLNRCGKMWVYVNPGTGYWGPANRFAVSSEISLIRLVAAAK